MAKLDAVERRHVFRCACRRPLGGIGHATRGPAVGGRDHADPLGLGMRWQAKWDRPGATVPLVSKLVSTPAGGAICARRLAVPSLPVLCSSL